MSISQHTHRSAGLSVSSDQLDEYALLSQVANMYYNHNMKVTEIASALFFSPAKVSRLLAQAREKKVVEITVRRVAGRITEQEEQLKARFGLKDAVVINSFADETERDELEIITEFAADYTPNLLIGRKTLGISNGTAVNLLVSKIQPSHRCELDVVQLLGSGGGAYKDIEARDLVDQMSEIYPGGRTFFLNTPIYIDNTVAREGLLQDSSISNTLNRMRNCDILLTGIGSFGTRGTTPPVIIQEYLTSAHIEELYDKQAAGCVCAQFYDIEGRLIDCSWNRNCISMPFDDIRKNPLTIGVACGSSKVVPILGALRAGLINVLVTGSDTALALCAKV